MTDPVLAQESLEAVLKDEIIRMYQDVALTAFDMQRRQVRWSHSASQEWTSSRPYVWRDMALAGDRGLLVAYALADGAVRWTHALQGMIRGIGVQGDTLYVGMLKGQVHALVDSTGSRHHSP